MVRAEVDIHPHRQFAVMTALLVGMIAALYLHVVTLGSHAAIFLVAFGAVPSRVLPLLHWQHPYLALDGLRYVAQAVFLHAGWLNVVANAILLLLYGPSVEDRLGHYRFLLLFLFSGAVAIFAQSLMMPDSHIALVGSEGGVAGVGGACLVISPRGQVPTMVRGIEFPWVFGPVAWLLVVILLSAVSLHPYPEVGTVALPYLLLAYAVGAGLGPLYRYQRPILLRG